MRKRLGVLAVLLLIALPTFAADRSIQGGIDPWYTPGNGKTFIDFKTIPLPAGFFCFKSEPFAGRVVFRGVPVATGEPGVLGKTDTIIQRLDEAVFNKKGEATTRIQVRVLHFQSVEPIQTACGAYNVEVRLNGEQPVTEMRIVRENDKGGASSPRSGSTERSSSRGSTGRPTRVWSSTGTCASPPTRGTSGPTAPT